MDMKGCDESPHCSFVHFKGYRVLRHLHVPVTFRMTNVRFNVPNTPLRDDSFRVEVNVLKTNSAIWYLESWSKKLLFRNVELERA